MLIRKIFFLFTINVICVFFFYPKTVYAKRVIRVGLFQNYPVVFQDKDGNPDGIYIDILKEIAKTEDLQLVYVPTTWNNCLENLRSRKIDLMVNITYTEERDAYMDFSKENVLMMWGQVYTRKGKKVQNILDLEGLKIAVLKGGINAINFSNLVEKFQLDCQLIPVDTQLEVFEMISSGQTDAGVLNNVFGAANEANYNVSLSPIFFNPFKLLFAVPEGINGEILKVVDENLIRWKQDKESVYYKILQKWYGAIHSQQTILPRWLIFALIGIGCAAILFLLWMRLLKKQVSERTFELQKEIDERKQIEEALLLSRTRYQALFQDSPVPLWEEEFSELFDYLEKLKSNGINDLRGYFYENPSQLQICAKKIKIKEVNQATLKLYNVNNKDELIGKMDKIFTEKFPDVFKEEVLALAAGKLEFESEGKVKNLTGGPTNIFLKLKIGKKDQDSVMGLLATVDTTEIRHLKAQLVQSQKLESIGNLAGGIAHDFNNILSSVLGFTELALDDVEKGSNVEDSLQEVYAAGKRAKDLVSQILAFARQSDEELKPIQVDIIVKEVLHFIRSSIPSTIKIKGSIDSDSLIMGNQTQVHQILMNLCTNAAHAMEEDGGVLDVSLKDIMVDENFDNNKLKLKNGNYIKVSVSDTGTGIAPDIMDSIFEPYFTTKGLGEGTGMGLAMVHGIVESYSGKIDVVSSLGKGSTFTIYLPVTRKRRLAHQNKLEKLPLGSERILFVDDEAQIARMSSQVLERLGYKVTALSSSMDAFDLFHSKPNDFDLVITDMTMPDLTGDQMAIKMMRIRPDIPVILCTGYSKKISEETAAGIGIKGFLYKPMAKSDLAKTIRKVLD